MPEQIKGIFKKQLLQERMYGKVRPIICTDFNEQKFVAVGNELHYSSKWKTFPDFLMDYIKHILGSGWGNTELKKTHLERHPIIKWFVESNEYMRKQKPDDDGIYKPFPNSVTAAYFELAYDLYTLRHHSLLQKDIIRRLKLVDQFQGARYELYVTASCIRAGFDIDFENERDGNQKHPEFIATHKKTGLRVAVEAKSKKSSKNMNGTCSLINLALKKENGLPFIVFVELNIPPDVAERELSLIFPNRVSNIIDQVAKSEDGKDRFNMIVLSNQAYQFVKGDVTAPSIKVYGIVSDNPKVPCEKSILFELNESAKQIKVPNNFDEIT